MSQPKPSTNEILDSQINFYTQPKWTDIFSYETRTTKQLLRRILQLATSAGRGDHVRKDGIYIEVWFASLVPVMQGYWRSGARSRRKKGVLDELHRMMLNIIFNDVFLPTEAFQKLKADEQFRYHDLALDDITKTIHKRTDEYVGAINAFLDRGSAPNSMPTELVESLLQNLFDGPDSSKKTSAEYVDANAARFTEVLTQIAIPMISAYGESMRGGPGQPPKQRTYFDQVQEIGGQAIVRGYRSIAAQNSIAPSTKTTDKKIVEIYSQVGRAFQQAAQQRGEHIPALRLNFIVLKFLQVYEEMGEQMLREHLQYEVDRYLASGLRPEYQKDLRLVK